MRTALAQPALVEKIAAILRDEVDAYKAAEFLGLPSGRGCGTCTEIVVAEFADGTEVAIRPFADIAGEPLCLGGDCQRDAAMAGWYHACNDLYCGDGCDAASTASHYAVGDVVG